MLFAAPDFLRSLLPDEDQRYNTHPQTLDPPYLAFQCGVADAEFTAQVTHLLTALIALEHGDDLGFAESGLFHGSKIRIVSIFDRANFGEAYSRT